MSRVLGSLSNSSGVSSNRINFYFIIIIYLFFLLNSVIYFPVLQPNSVCPSATALHLTSSIVNTLPTAMERYYSAKWGLWKATLPRVENLSTLPRSTTSVLVGLSKMGSVRRLGNGTRVDGTTTPTLIGTWCKSAPYLLRSGKLSGCM